jgi:hypothetical protein
MREADEALAQSVDLGSGVRMPLLGLGTWLAGGRAAYQAVRRALDCRRQDYLGRSGRVLAELIARERQTVD